MMNKKKGQTNKIRTENGHFAIMSDFIIKYRLGKGSKIRTHTVKEADGKKDASIRFQNESPDNAILIEIETVTAPPKPSRRVYRRMIIKNSFDQFILDQLQEKSLTNNDLIEHVGMNRAAWGKMRRNPENLYYHDMIRMCEFLNIPMATLIDELSKVVKQNETTGTLDPARFRTKQAKKLLLNKR